VSSGVLVNCSGHPVISLCCSRDYRPARQRHRRDAGHRNFQEVLMSRIRIALALLAFVFVSLGAPAIAALV
jgi:hypothetical protein